jgi:4-hydroxy-3-methylbut-2-enyl diphosphate reductase
MRALRKKNIPLYTLGPLIHNNTVTSELESYGVKTLKDTQDVKPGTYVLIRSHGVTPTVRQELINKGAKIIDATCPKVAKVQGIIRKNVADGFFIVIVGDNDHAETKGLLGYAGGSGTIISSNEDLEAFIKDNEKDMYLCVVAQTTQDINVFEKTCKRLKEHFKKVKEINTICDATKNRQEEVALKACEADCTLVVGGKHSANTTRLFEIAKGICKGKVSHMERAEEFLPEMMGEGCAKVFISAGASTPLWIVHEIAEKINRSRPMNILLRVLSSFPFMIFAILSAFALSYFKSEDKYALVLGIVIIASMILASTGIRHIYLEKLDVFKIAYTYGRRYFITGIILLCLLALLYDKVLWVFVLYYCILFYMVYKIMVPRALLISLCNIIFLLVPWSIS